MIKNNYIDVSQEQGRHYFSSSDPGEVIMLNLLKFKEVADYKASPELKPYLNISGEEAYNLYANQTIPLLKEAGSEVLFMGSASNFLIGPMDETWDKVLLVKHASKEAFLKFASDPTYLKIKGHRTAALEDSRLLPIKK